MFSIDEMSKKVSVSFGMIAGLIVGTFLVTSFYFETVTLSDRLDKRYNRLDERLNKIEQELWKD